jgi:hypothetical protein
LKDVRSALDNLMKAIEKGVFTRTTKARLEELEAEEERLIKCIQEEEAKIPKISKEMILYTLYKYRDMDMRVQKNRERLIDGFVKAIIVYDDYFKVHLTYTDEPIDMPTTEEIEFMDQSSDIASAVSPKKTPPNRVVSFLPYGNRKAVKKSVRWTLFRPWEIPFFSDCGPAGSGAEKKQETTEEKMKDTTRQGGVFFAVRESKGHQEIIPEHFPTRCTYASDGPNPMVILEVLFQTADMHRRHIRLSIDIVSVFRSTDMLIENIERNAGSRFVC